MAGGSRSELASSSPEGSSFTPSCHNGMRGSYTGFGMERSGSFREILDNRVTSSGTGAGRNLGSANSEFSSLSNCLMLEPLSLGDQKYTRYGELRRVLRVSLGEHSFGLLQTKLPPPVAPEELKHFKASVQDTSSRARDRENLLHESITKLDKFRNLPSRKRSRSESASGEKSAGLLKMGNHVLQNSSDNIARLEDRTKNGVPNKRMRSSMVEVRMEGRGNVLLRQGIVTDREKLAMERDKNILRACNGGANVGEGKNRGLPNGGDGWEKNMKKKRSTGASVARAVDGDQEFKQGLQQRLKNENRSRGCDGIGIGSGLSSGINGINKLDGSLQPIFDSSSNIPKCDLDNNALSNDRRENSSFDKERNIHKGSSKGSVREGSLVGSQSPLTKGKGSRAPRTGSSPVASVASLRATAGFDGWEQNSNLNKIQQSGATNIRKRCLPTGPSPPHVAQWVGQRPQKMSRTRRTNLVSPVSCNEESQNGIDGFPAPDISSRSLATDSDVPLPSRGISNAPILPDMKPESVPSPAILSESEELIAAANKYKEKVTSNCEDGSLNAVRKTVVLPTKKNKSTREDTGEGIRKHGRSGGRGLAQVKSGLPLRDKFENIQTAKSARSGRPGSDRIESKTGRPPKKYADRKACFRPVPFPTDGSDDYDELMAAANYARNSSDHSCCNLFWKTMEPLFASVGPDKIAWLTEQIAFAKELDGSLKVGTKEQPRHPVLASSQESKEKEINDIQFGEASRAFYSNNDSYQADLAEFGTDKWLQRIVPLSQRIVAAIIPEFGNNSEYDQTDPFSWPLMAHQNPYNTSSGQKDNETKVGVEFDLEMIFPAHKNTLKDDYSCNGHAEQNNIMSPNTNNHSYSNGMPQENNIDPFPDTKVLHKSNQNGMKVTQMICTDNCGTSSSLFQYEQMSLDDKILLELQSIGLDLEMVPDLADAEDQLDKDISDLKMKLHHQVGYKKTELLKLQKALQDKQVSETRNLEQLAMNKLVEIAQRKLLGGRGSHGSSSKSGVSKVPKQAALGFAKRTLDRCQKFESSGSSCFGEPPFRSILCSTPMSRHAAKAEARDSKTESNILGPPRAIGDGHGAVNLKHGRDSETPSQSPQMQDQSCTKYETIPNRGKKREILLDDVGNALSRATTSALGNSIPGSAKGKRSDRERDQNKDTLARGSVAKVGRPSLGCPRGERKTKSKLKQKTAQLSTSGVFLGRNMDGGCTTINNDNGKEKEKVGTHDSGNNISRDMPKEIEGADFSDLPLNGTDSIEGLSVDAELGVPGNDLDSWLNIGADLLPENGDEDLLPENGLMGLEIPNDDLSELNMNF